MRGPGKRAVSVRNEEIRVHRMRNIRWGVIVFVSGLFFASYAFDIQILEGTLSGSRLLGFHMADPYATAQIILATRHIPVNLVIGVVTVGLIYLAIGGRTFCSWVCPYHLLAEWAEALHLKLVEKRIVKNHTFDYRLKYVVWLMFLLLAAITGYTFYETVSPPALLTRFFVYGSWGGLLVIGALLAIEVLYSRRFWCRYLCPTGTTYNFIGRAAPLKIKWNQDRCTNCKECQAVCMVPFVLADTVNRGKLEYVVSGECTRCGLCVDACQDGALKYSVRYLDKIV